MSELYVIKRTDGQYVSKPGMKHSYTRYLQKARNWPNRRAALSEVCPENERVVSLADEMLGR